MNKKRKLLAISSPGGHWIQLNKVCNSLEQRFDVVYATPGAQYSSAKNDRIIHTITDASATSKLKLIPLSLQLLWLLIRERPQAIISTGAAPGAIIMLIAKFLPIKTIWLDSIANTAKLSRSGEMVRKHADLVLTQWEALSDEQQVLYRGSVL